MSFTDILFRGGFLMIPICLCSIFALAIILERLVKYAKVKGNFGKLTDKLEPLIVGNKLGEAILLCEESKGAISRLYLIALQELQKNIHIKRSIEEEMTSSREVMDEELLVSIVPTLERNLNGLDTLARGTPLLGLLGTVIGMIQVFFTLGLGGRVPDPSILAKGIGLALITTAAGLVVAIPSFFMHRYFEGRVDSLLNEAQKAKVWLISQLAKRRLLTMDDDDEY
jgi:biopolymer transport protein ExbB